MKDAPKAVVSIRHGKDKTTFRIGNLSAKSNDESDLHNDLEMSFGEQNSKREAVPHGPPVFCRAGNCGKINPSKNLNLQITGRRYVV